MTDGAATQDIAVLRTWIGRSIDSRDVVDLALVERFCATLNLDRLDLNDGAPAPAGIHWCLAPLVADTSTLGPDGHPQRGGFLPPVSLPRRMWAGGELAFTGVFRLGDTVDCRSTIEDVQLKQGRTGVLCFVTVRHLYSVRGAPVLDERQDIVYREADARVAAPAAVTSQQEFDASVTVAADPVLLFRYSALTFNGHRIHYDRRFCVEVESYPGLVVHGPLQATVLLRLAIDHASSRVPMRFSFRGQAPLFDGPFTAKIRRNGDAALWIEDAHGQRTMLAEATWVTGCTA